MLKTYVFIIVNGSFGQIESLKNKQFNFFYVTIKTTVSKKFIIQTSEYMRVYTILDSRKCSINIIVTVGFMWYFYNQNALLIKVTS